jgi:hypothetical protein
MVISSRILRINGKQMPAILCAKCDSDLLCFIFLFLCLLSSVVTGVSFSFSVCLGAQFL